MQLIRHGFTIKNEVLEISSIKPGGSGTMEGRPYPASVKFRSLNIIEDNFEDTFKEEEQIIEYKINCSSSLEASQVTDVLRKFRVANTPIYINTAIPKIYQGGQIYSATSLDNAEKFLSMNNFKLPIKEEVKKS